MTTEERLSALEKELAELKRQASTQPDFSFQSDERFISIVITTDKRKYKIEA